MTLPEIRAEHARGAILGLLDGADIWLNDAELHDSVQSLKRVSVDREEIRDAMRWLAKQRMVELDEFDPPGGARSILRARILRRGSDFEAGHVFVEGIRRRGGG